jgi:DNA replication protein DnaC
MNNKTYDVDEIRNKHKNAYAKWTAEEEAVLVDLNKKNLSASIIAKKMGRQKGAIRSRLRKIAARDDAICDIPIGNEKTEQDLAYELLLSGKNVLITGKPGTGKTYLLNRFIRYLKENKIPAGITASTGIASTHIDGQTIHSWAGFGIRESLTSKDLGKITNNDYVCDRIRSSKVLIIDEVSMLHDFQFDMADKICRIIRDNLRPFGGLQIVLCGDFYQLPPVTKGKHRGRFITSSKVWEELNLQVSYLTKQYRHTDFQLSKILDGIRSNCIDEKSIKLLLAKVDAKLPQGIEPTRIYSHNSTADAYNQDKLEKIQEEEHKFTMKWGGNKKYVETLKRDCLSPEELILKKGAVVMFVRNNKMRGYVNGTTGAVVGYNEEGYPIIEVFKTKKNIIAMPEKWQVDESFNTVAWISQVPLRLAWAITIHKSQGMTLDYAEIDLSKSFTYSLGYVALSRVRALEGMVLRGFNGVALKVSKEAIEIDSYLLHQMLNNVAVNRGETANILNEATDTPAKNINEEFVEIQSDKNFNETDFQELADLKKRNNDLYEDYSKARLRYEEKAMKDAGDIASLTRINANLKVELIQLNRQTYRKGPVHIWFIVCGIIIILLIFACLI